MYLFISNWLARVTLVHLCLLLVSCMVGPDFHPPKPPPVQRYTESPMPKRTVETTDLGKPGKSQVFIAGADIPNDWWHLFHSKQLNFLIQTGIANSPNLSAAFAALRQSQEVYNAQIGTSLFPALAGQFGAQRQRYAGSAFGSTTGTTASTSLSTPIAGTSMGVVPSSIFNLFNANVSVTYALDVFGGARRQIESLGAQVDYQQFELIAAYLSLTSNIVTTSVQIAALKAEIRSTLSVLKDEENELRIIRTQFQLGGLSNANVLTQETLVEQTRATIPPLEKKLSQSRHALAVLIGHYPDEKFPEVELEQLSLPTHLPVSLPSNLVRQRPDVRAAESLLHASNAMIGVATANLFPQITLTGNYGWEAGVASNLFSSSSKIWSMAGQLTQPLFQGGALLANRRAAIDAFDQSYAQYRQTVLTGFQNVADSLRAIADDARTLKATRAAEVAARKSYKLSSDQYRLGGVSYLQLLNAEEQYQQTLLKRIQAEAERYNDTVALFQSLGGGWWNKPWCEKECFYERG